MDGLLGSRPIDLEYDFLGNQTNCGLQISYLKNFIEAQKLSGSDSTVNRPVVQQVFFSKEQLRILNKVKELCARPKEIRDAEPFKILIQSLAGHGKTLLVSAICGHMRLMGIHYQVIGYTGNIASAYEAGRTLHSAFSVWWKAANFEKLALEETHKKSYMYECLRDMEVLVLEEIFYFSPHHLAFIDAKLQSIKQCTKDFGGCSIIFGGDLLQSVPIIYGPLYQHRDLAVSEFARRGIDLYRKINIVYQLTNNYRQKHDYRFQQLLFNIRHKRVTQEDVDLLNTRLYKNLPQEEKERFHDALKIFPYKKQVECENIKCIRELNVPVTIVSSYQVPAIQPILMETRLIVGKGVRIILSRNMDLKHKLYRGSGGTIEGWTFHNGRIEIIFVRFDNYTGDTISGCVPVGRICEIIKTDHNRKNIKFYYHPLELAHSRTSHSTQGMNLSKVCVYLGSTEHFISQAYVSLSRTTSLSNLCLLDKREIKLSRFNDKNFMKGYNEQKAELDRLGITESLKAPKTTVID